MPPSRHAFRERCHRLAPATAPSPSMASRRAYFVVVSALSSSSSGYNASGTPANNFSPSLGPACVVLGSPSAASFGGLGTSPGMSPTAPPFSTPFMFCRRATTRSARACSACVKAVVGDTSPAFEAANPLDVRSGVSRRGPREDTAAPCPRSPSQSCRLAFARPCAWKRCSLRRPDLPRSRTACAASAGSWPRATCFS